MSYQPDEHQPDELGAELVAVGLIRATADQLLGTISEEEHVRRCLDLVAGWIGDPEGDRELREPLLLVLDALARCAASYLVKDQGSTQSAETWLAEQSVKAGAAAREAGDPHPAAPVSLAQARLHVEARAAAATGAATDEELDLLETERYERHAGRCDLYVRGESIEQDAYKLIINGSRLAATVLVHLTGRDRALVEQQLDSQVTHLIASAESEVPSWVPSDPGKLTVQAEGAEHPEAGTGSNTTAGEAPSLAPHFREHFRNPDGYDASQSPRYRAFFRGQYGDHEPIDPTYPTLADAQKRCEEDLRAQRPNKEMDLTWETAVEYLMWEMVVRTPMLPNGAHIGYGVAVEGTVYDGGEPEQWDAPPQEDGSEDGPSGTRMSFKLPGLREQAEREAEQSAADETTGTGEDQ